MSKSGIRSIRLYDAMSSSMRVKPLCVVRCASCVVRRAKRNTQYAIRNTRYAKGFTIIEILLATGIIVFVLTSAYSALRIGWLSYSRLDSQSQVYHNLRSRLNNIGKDLRNAFLFNLSEKSDKKTISFSGTKEKMSFTTLSKSRNKEGMGYREVSEVFYKFEDKKLLKAFLKGTDILNTSLKPEYEVFLADITALEFSYAVEKTSMQGELNWKDTFDNKTMLPIAVRIKLTQEIKGFPPASFTKSINLE